MARAKPHDRHKFLPGDRVMKYTDSGVFLTLGVPCNQRGTVVWQDKRPSHFDHAIVLLDKPMQYPYRLGENYLEFVPVYLRNKRNRLCVLCVMTIKYLGVRLNPEKLV